MSKNKEKNEEKQKELKKYLEGNPNNLNDYINDIRYTYNLDLQILNSEAELAEKKNILRNTLISMEQQKLSLRQEQLQPR